MTVQYRYIGKGKTDANGVAHITEDAEGNDISSNPGYTGVGAGELDMVASVEKPISSGSVVSQPYSVWDTKFYDLATDNTKESSWYIDTTNTSVSYDGDGRTVTKTDNSQSWRYIFYDSNAITSTKVGGRYAILIPNIIEFDITAITGSIIFEIRDDNNNSMTNQGAIATGHYKIVLDGTDCKMYKNDATTPFGTGTMNGTNIRFAFIFNALNESITYKNFKVYSY